ncbi:MAG TPA: succinate dehydrogenase assembly factor 2 [Burkholderiales bacterium]|jgi:antitoxin CptB|nr:succinate dehydrogenase assembly factor 2 [Burkholderiales bacterium]
MDRAARDRLRWRCRRGLLELDLVFERFLPTLAEAEREAFEALLELADQPLWDIVAGRSDDYDPQLTAIVARLRAA